MDEQERATQTRRAASGDQDALQRLIVVHHVALRAAVSDKMGAATRRHVDPEDVLQAAYVAAFKAIPGLSFDGPAGLYKWLETIALNELRDWEKSLRRKKRDIGRDIHAGSAAATSYIELANRMSVSDSTPSRHLQRREAVAALLSSMARLTDDQREVIHLRFLEGRPVAEVALRLGKTSGAVHMLCHRGLGALERMMGSISEYLSRL